MDIVVCFDCSFSMAFHIEKIRPKICSGVRKALSHGQNNIRVSFVGFQSHMDEPVTIVKPFTSSIETFEGWFNAVETKGGLYCECRATADALHECLQLDWRTSNERGVYVKKLVILITDGPPCNLLNNKCERGNSDLDLWQLSKQFQDQNIPLVLIGIEPDIRECDDFYFALADNTDGDYIPLVDASCIPSSIFKKVVSTGTTVTKLPDPIDVHKIDPKCEFNLSSVKSRADHMIKYCRTMNDIKQELYWYYHKQNQSDTPTHQSNNLFLNMNASDNDDDDDDDSNSFSFSPLRNLSIHDHLYSHQNIIASTPVTDDEGYRTRLPTTASADSSFIEFGDTSPVFTSDIMDLNDSNEFF